MKPPFNIPGFLNNPKRTAKNKIYRGRFTCQSVQWTGSSQELMATFTITAQEIADAAESGLLWTDQDVQRGIRPGAKPFSLKGMWWPRILFSSMPAERFATKGV